MVMHMNHCSDLCSTMNICTLGGVGRRRLGVCFLAHHEGGVQHHFAASIRGGHDA